MTDYEHTLTVAIKAISELIEDNRKLASKLELLELAYEGCTGHGADYDSFIALYSKGGEAVNVLGELKPHACSERKCDCGCRIETLRESKDCPKSNQGKHSYKYKVDSNVLRELISDFDNPCDSVRLADFLTRHGCDFITILEVI